MKWPGGQQRWENKTLARKSGIPQVWSPSTGSPRSRGGGRPCKTSHSLLEHFLPFPKLLSLFITPQTGYETNRNEFGMGPGEGDWGLEELLAERLVMLGDIVAGCGDETAGAGLLAAGWGAS